MVTGRRWTPREIPAEREERHRTWRQWLALKRGLSCGGSPTLSWCELLRWEREILGFERGRRRRGVKRGGRQLRGAEEGEFRRV